MQASKPASANTACVQLRRHELQELLKAKHSCVWNSAEFQLSMLEMRGGVQLGNVSGCKQGILPSKEFALTEGPVRFPPTYRLVEGPYLPIVF